MRVMDSRFSTVRISHWASLRTSSSSASCSARERPGFSSTAEAEPTMEVRGVRMSWETERRRLARIFSFSFSARSCSCRLIWVVRVLVMTDTARKLKKVRG